MKSIHTETNNNKKKLGQERWVYVCVWKYELLALKAAQTKLKKKGNIRHFHSLQLHCHRVLGSRDVDPSSSVWYKQHVDQWDTSVGDSINMTHHIGSCALCGSQWS